MMTAPHPSFSSFGSQPSHTASPVPALSSLAVVRHVPPRGSFPTDGRAEARPSSWWRRRLGPAEVLGLVGATLLGMASAIEVARAFSQTPEQGAEIENVLSGLLVALFCIAGFGQATRLRGLAPASALSIFGLVTHGAVLVLGGHVVGAMFLGIAPLVALSGRATMSDAWSAPSSPSLLPTAPAAEPAASPSHVITLR